MKELQIKFEKETEGIIDIIDYFIKEEKFKDLKFEDVIRIAEEINFAVNNATPSTLEKTKSDIEEAKIKLRYM